MDPATPPSSQRRYARRGRRVLALLMVYACAAESAPEDDFAVFWQQFQTAVEQGGAADVAALTRFPFQFENEERRDEGFDVVHAALFDTSARACLADAQPAAEGDGYQVQCGAIIYVFGREDGQWRFTEFAADPEALEESGASGIGGPAGTWRIARGVRAPWSPPATDSSAISALRGGSLEFAAGTVTGPALLACDEADYEYLVTPAEGLFQGNLSTAGSGALHALGIRSLPVMTLRVTCTGGSFDYHFTAADILLTALDNVVWRLERGPVDEAPGSVVQALLVEHMTGDMAFTEALLTGKRRYFSRELNGLLSDYFAQRFPVDEPPPINGDPITDSQEYPTGFRISQITSDEMDATVDVTFTDGLSRRPVRMLLQRMQDEWLITDMVYERGENLRRILRESLRAATSR